MPQYQYRVINAPDRGVKAKGVKSPEDRFAHALEEVMNRMAADGWEYQRAESLPSVERSGLLSRATNWRNLLVFRKALDEAIPGPAAVVLPGARSRSEPPVTPHRPDTSQTADDPQGERDPLRGERAENGASTGDTMPITATRDLYKSDA